MSDHKCVSMVEEIITCSICVELIDDPRVLQCLHTFCYKCLVQHLSSKDKQDEIECPVCHKWCPLPNGNVDELPVSFLYNQLKDANTAACGEKQHEQDEGAVVHEDDKPRFTCSTPECSGTNAVAFCEMCRYICSKCESVHKTIDLLKRHSILSLEKAVKDKHNELPICAKHPREIVKLYCEDCQLPICLLCYPLNHAQHKCSEIIEKSSKVKGELKGMIETIDSYLDTCDEISKQVVEHSEAVDVSADLIKNRISARTDTIGKEAIQHKETFIACVDLKYKQAQKVLQHDTDRVHMLRMTLDSVKSCAVKVLVHSKPCDFFQSVPSIKKQLDELNPDDVSIILKDMDVTEVTSKLDNLKLIDDAMVKKQRFEEKDEKIAKLEIRNKELEKELLLHQQNMPQPPGGKWFSFRGTHLKIKCVFPDGIQNAAHPRPGQPYEGQTLTHTIYKTTEGSGVVKLLEKAFHAQILVTVKENSLCWNGDIFRAYSYYEDSKDPSRIRTRLAEIGIK